TGGLGDRIAVLGIAGLLRLALRHRRLLSIGNVCVPAQLRKVRLPPSRAVQTLAGSPGGRMRGLFAAVCVLVLMGCQRGAGGPGNGLPGGDAGDAGPDGSICVGSRYPCSDGGTPDAGPDAGPTETPDAGPAHTIGGLGWGPFPHAPMTIYGSADGLLEAPVSASVDEGENLWVATEKALYVLQPGAKVFRRYTAQDGLHVGAGYTEPPDFTMVEGGGPGEAFVGYYAHDTNTSMFPDAHWYTDPIAHMGKMDQVLLHADGTLTVNRYDLRNTNDGRYYETRTVMSMVYDHFQHPGNLYVGSNHGITRIVPAKYFPPRRDPADPGWNNDEKVWYADHVHPWVCLGGPCDDKHPSVFGDWFGLTLAPDGRLWMGGLTCAGALNFREALGDWIQSWEPVNPFDPA